MTSSFEKTNDERNKKKKQKRERKKNKEQRTKDKKAKRFLLMHWSQKKKIEEKMNKTFKSTSECRINCVTHLHMN